MRARGGIAQLSEIIRELTQLSEGVHRGTAVKAFLRELHAR